MSLPSITREISSYSITGYLQTDIFCERVEPKKQTSATGLKIRIPARPSGNPTTPRPVTVKQAPHPLSPLLIPEKVYKRVGSFLWNMLRVEKDSNYYPPLTSLSWSETKRIFLEQISGYFRGVPPYNTYNGDIPLLWWRSHKHDPKWFLIVVSQYSTAVNITLCLVPASCNQVILHSAELNG